MLVLHEGLPGSGKSYAAIQDHLLPCVKSGRKVYTNIKGINHERIAKLCGIELAAALDLVRIIPWEETKNAAKLVENDSFVILDELQDFWPASNKPLKFEDSEFVTQHRQRGLELLILTQDSKSIHSIWRQRIERKLEFVNRDAIGKPKEYIVRSFNAAGKDSRGNQTYQLISSDNGTYKPEIYACYTSHAPNVTNTEKTKDKRFNVFKSSAFVIWIPAAFIVAFIGIGYLWSFFHPTAKAAPVSVANKTAPANVASSQPAPPLSAAAPPVSAANVEAPVPRAAAPGDYIEFMLAKYRPRLEGVIYTASRLSGQIAFMDDGYRAQERLSLDELRGMGWTVKRMGEGVLIAKVDREYIVTGWPVEPFGSNAQAVQHAPAVSGQL